MWIFGALFNRREIGVIGSVFVFITGAMIANNGLEHKVGERIEFENNRTYDNVILETNPDETSLVNHTNSSGSRVVEFQYSRAGLPRRGAIGGLLMLVGGLLAIYALEEQAPTL